MRVGGGVGYRRLRLAGGWSVARALRVGWGRAGWLLVAFAGWLGCARVLWLAA